MRQPRSLATDALVAELLAGRTVTDSAEAAGMSRATAYRRLDDPEVRAMLTRTRDDRLRAMADDATAGAREGIAFLREVVRTPYIRMGDRIRAAVALAALHLPLTEAVEFEARIAALEAAAAERPALMAVNR
jgi:hypothetical protein